MENENIKLKQVITQLLKNHYTACDYCKHKVECLKEK